MAVQNRKFDGICPLGFVDLAEACPEIERVMAYSTPLNFTGASLPGYAGKRAWIHQSCEPSLKAIVTELAGQGFGLRLYDAYRPDRAVKAMLDWARKNGRWELVEKGFLSEQSRHSKGCAVDVTLVDLETGEALDMGTAWDAFTPHSYSAWGQGLVRVNRERLRGPFVSRGWRAAKTEWWHFDLEQIGLKRLDVAYE
jgi:D-alanyl-D-alanine dipeptidase